VALKDKVTFAHREAASRRTVTPLALTRRIIAKSGEGIRPDNITELPTVDRSHHIFMPFSGGSDAQAAFSLALQLAENAEVTAIVVHYQIRVDGTSTEDSLIVMALPEVKIRVLTSCDKSDDDSFITMQNILSDSLRSRVTFRTSISYGPVRDAVTDAQNEVGQNLGNGGDIVMLGRTVKLVEAQASSCLGLVADVIYEKNIKASIVVLQARRE
jgi:hypothetical protein